MDLRDQKASEIERRLLEMLPQNGDVDLKLLHLYSLGKSETEASKTLSEPLHYVVDFYFVFNRACLLNDIEPPKNVH